MVLPTFGWRPHAGGLGTRSCILVRRRQQPIACSEYIRSVHPNWIFFNHRWCSCRLGCSQIFIRCRATSRWRRTEVVTATWHMTCSCIRAQHMAHEAECHRSLCNPRPHPGPNVPCLQPVRGTVLQLIPPSLPPRMCSPHQVHALASTSVDGNFTAMPRPFAGAALIPQAQDPSPDPLASWDVLPKFSTLLLMQAQRQRVIIIT